MGLAVVVSAAFAMVFQGVNFVDLMNYAFNGFSIETGVSIVDPMLNRGGVLSMSELLVTFMVASVMGAVITSTGILDVLGKKCSFKIYQESYSISICHFSILLCRELLNSWRTNSIYHCN